MYVAARFECFLNVQGLLGGFKIHGDRKYILGAFLKVADFEVLPSRFFFCLYSFSSFSDILQTINRSRIILLKQVKEANEQHNVEHVFSRCFAPGKLGCVCTKIFRVIYKIHSIWQIMTCSARKFVNIQTHFPTSKILSYYSRDGIRRITVNLCCGNESPLSGNINSSSQ